MAMNDGSINNQILTGKLTYIYIYMSLLGMATRIGAYQKLIYPLKMMISHSFLYLLLN